MMVKTTPKRHSSDGSASRCTLRGLTPSRLSIVGVRSLRRRREWCRRTDDFSQPLRLIVWGASKLHKCVLVNIANCCASRGCAPSRADLTGGQPSGSIKVAAEEAIVKWRQRTTERRGTCPEQARHGGQPNVEETGWTKPLSYSPMPSASNCVSRGWSLGQPSMVGGQLSKRRWGRCRRVSPEATARAAPNCRREPAHAEKWRGGRSSRWRSEWRSARPVTPVSNCASRAEPQASPILLAANRQRDSEDDAEVLLVCKVGE